MELHSIETGRFKLDGGAMFGIVPKPLWERTNPADDKNRIDLAMRCLLIQSGNRLALVDNGIGQKYDDKFAKIYAVDHSTTLDDSLNALGYHREDITDLILTHLHFDHCGGTTRYNSAKDRFEVQFPNATLWLQRKHLEWARESNPREKASFLSENIAPIANWDNLELLEGEADIFPGVGVKVVHGHTESQQLPYVHYKGQTVLFSADLYPTRGHLPLPYVMGYDVRPLETLKDRQRMTDWIIRQNAILFFEHDPTTECALLSKDDKGRLQVDRAMPLSDL